MDEQTILSLARQNAESADSLSDIFCTSLKGRVALVTGGATGLGYNVVHRLAEAGAKVVIASRKEERGQKAVREFTEQGYTVSWIRTDVSKVSDCQNAVDYTVKTYEKIDILVANAAGWSNYSYLDVTEKEYDRILDTDLKGAYFIGQAAARAMVRDKIKGKIIFISSAAHLGDGPSHTVMNTFYIAAKSGVAGMTKGIAGELRQYGIGVNCVAPGGMLSAGVFTEGSEAAALYGPEYEETRKLHGKDTPVTMNPDEVARVVYAMCTPMSDFMCGAVVDVNGGATLNFQEKPFSYTVEGCIPGPQR
ncbi:SDR family NAD(P)-dependent oxidoreductase [Lactonifactor longoviformis]|uniref:2-deoxy-D-gluconate 3-dehydrogenase n=1 Tax=Lactonifactor longoviformis DSM 17459 TaxID=1122155 RepID=A0A1M5CHF9_9CLOT|nr:SDR family oxidoreductase [Lactonifactor longoviformis]SHF54205.1 2-deoxy-D-gluconate 3-dehydrogenase [Lactonifactor longoviformis DSM 17459]